MIKTLPGLALLIVLAGSCKEFSDASYMEDMSRMKDSIFKAYPTVRAINMNVENRSLLIITLGDRQLYKKDDAARKGIAMDLGNMTLRIFGKDAGIDQQKLIVTADERNTVSQPADGKAVTTDLTK